MINTDTMTPTTKLRFVKKQVPSPEHGKGISKLQNVLQQWWSNADAVKMGPTHMIKGEWRDVPTEDDPS
jgi:hypothetical protein